MFSDSFLNAPPPKTLEIGQVLGGTFAAMRRNWLIFLVVGLVFEVAPAAVYSFFSGQATPATDITQLTHAFGRLSYVVLSGFVLHPLSVAVIAWTVWSDEAGTRPTIVDALRATFSHAPAIVLAYLLMALVLGFAAILLIIPGLMAATAFYVTVPVCVNERLGAPESLSRSLELTRGQRWRILGLYVVLLLIGLALTTMAGLVSMMAGFSFVETHASVVIVPRLLLTGVSTVFGAACVGSAYVELRTLREGARSRSVAEVFA